LSISEDINTSPIDILSADLVNDFIILKALGKEDPKSIKELGEKYGLTLSNTLSNDSDAIELTILGLLASRIEETGGLYVPKPNNDSVDIFNLLVKKINSHNTYRPKVQGINNYSTFITHKVLNDPRNATTAYKSIDVATDAFSSPIKRIKWDLVPGNKDNGHLIS
jgi:hypothetical protein